MWYRAQINDSATNNWFSIWQDNHNYNQRLFLPNRALTSWSNPPARQTWLSDAWVRWTVVSHTKPQVATTISQSAHISPQASDSVTPINVDLQKSQPKTWKYYNCQKIGHLTNNYPEPHKQHSWNDFSEKDISDIIAKESHCPSIMIKRNKRRWKQIFDLVSGHWWKTHPIWPIFSQFWKIVW